jgi:hypothetical protein
VGRDVAEYSFREPRRESATLERAADRVFIGADDEIRTRDPHLGKVMLYQLSHIRIGIDNLAVEAPDRTTRPAPVRQR